MASVTETISSGGSWTDSIKPKQVHHHSMFGHLAVTVDKPSSSSTTVTLQRSFDGGSNWKDVDTFTTSIEETIYDPTEGILYRIGVASGDFDSSSPLDEVDVGLYQDAG